MASKNFHKLLSKKVTRDCLTWTKYPDSVTRVWNGSTVALKWDYSLTTEEQNAANIAINRVWDRGNESHFEFVASKNFITGQSVAYAEDFAPHITISRSEEATLIINEVVKEDEGVYKFTVRFLTLGDRRISRNFSLEVRGKITVKGCSENCILKLHLSCVIPPSAEISNKTSVAALGESLNFTCTASGKPKPRIAWTKVGSSEVISHALQVTVNVSRPGTEDNMIQYQCTASNGVGTPAIATVNVTVQFKPEITQFQTSAANHKVCRNDVIKFSCSADANPPVISYQLFENNTAILDKNLSGMWLRNMSIRGVFIHKCVVNNTLGTVHSEWIAVSVNGPPAIQAIENQTLTEGGNMTLTCLASEGPSLVVSWIKPDGQRVNTNILKLITIKRSEAGEYRCVATNDCGSVTHTTGVEVQCE
nr:peroxidasin homolog [Pocillopora verrucosa]